MQYLKKFIINSQLQENNTKNFFGTIFGPLVAIIFFIMIITTFLRTYLNIFYRFKILKIFLIIFCSFLKFFINANIKYELFIILY